MKQIHGQQKATAENASPTSKSYFKIWLHVEEITLDENGQEEDYISLDEEFMPISLTKFPDKQKVVETWKAVERLMDLS